MPIRATTLNKDGEKFIMLDSTATLNSAFQELKKQGHRANETYLIFSQSGKAYQVVLFSELQKEWGWRLMVFSPAFCGYLSFLASQKLE